MITSDLTYNLIYRRKSRLAQSIDRSSRNVSEVDSTADVMSDMSGLAEPLVRLQQSAVVFKVS